MRLKRNIYNELASIKEYTRMLRDIANRLEEIGLDKLANAIEPASTSIDTCVDNIQEILENAD